MEIYSVLIEKRIDRNFISARGMLAKMAANGIRILLDYFD